MLRTRDARRTLSFATLVGLLAISGCHRDTIAGPTAAEPALQQAPSPRPPTLDGEVLTGADAFSMRQRGDCRTDDVVTLNYAIRGAAAGPYTGTFVEVGRWTLTFRGSPFATRWGFEAAFTIFSPTGLVVGTKSSAPIEGSLLGLFNCRDDGVVFAPAGFGVGLHATYSATIRTRAGAFRDAGRTDAIFFHVSGTVPPPYVFTLTERFTSTQATTRPIESDDDHN